MACRARTMGWPGNRTTSPAICCVTSARRTEEAPGFGDQGASSSDSLWARRELLTTHFDTDVGSAKAIHHVSPDDLQDADAFFRLVVHNRTFLVVVAGVSVALALALIQRRERLL